MMKAIDSKRPPTRSLHRSIPAGALLLLLLTGCADSRTSPAGDPPPNVILLVVDTFRADHIHGYGYERETTPMLDRLIRDGVRFDAAISPSSWSAPAHVTLATGVQPYNHKVMGWHQKMEDGVEPLGPIMKRQGYSTGLFSSHFVLHNAVKDITEGMDARLVLRNEDDERVLYQAVQWARTAAKPYLLYICLMTPHAPYDKYPPEYDERYFTDLPPGGDRTFPFTDETWVGEGGIPRSVRLDDHDRLGYYVNRYDRSIRHVDALIHRFWTAMGNLGLLDDTLLVVTSDHGEGLGDHDTFAHELYLYDFLIRVPLIVHYPGTVPGGQRWTEQVSLADVVPTILGLAGLRAPDTVDGRDLSRWLVSSTRPDESPLITGSYRWRGFDRYMVRSDRYKLLLDAASGREEFYDLTADPEETDDLAASGAAGDGYDELRAAMKDLLARHAAVDPRRLDDVPRDPEVIEKLRSLGYVGQNP